MLGVRGAQRDVAHVWAVPRGPLESTCPRPTPILQAVGFAKRQTSLLPQAQAAMPLALAAAIGGCRWCPLGAHWHCSKFLGVPAAAWWVSSVCPGCSAQQFVHSVQVGRCRRGCVRFVMEGGANRANGSSRSHPSCRPRAPSPCPCLTALKLVAIRCLCVGANHAIRSSGQLVGALGVLVYTGRRKPPPSVDTAAAQAREASCWAAAPQQWKWSALF